MASTTKRGTKRGTTRGTKARRKTTSAGGKKPSRGMRAGKPRQERATRRRAKTMKGTKRVTKGAAPKATRARPATRRTRKPKDTSLFDRATSTLRKAADTAMGVTQTAIDRVRP